MGVYQRRGGEREKGDPMPQDNTTICDQCGREVDLGMSYTCEGCGITICDECMIYKNKRHLCGECADEEAEER